MEAWTCYGHVPLCSGTAFSEGACDDGDAGGWFGSLAPLRKRCRPLVAIALQNATARSEVLGVAERLAAGSGSATPLSGGECGLGGRVVSPTGELVDLYAHDGGEELCFKGKAKPVPFHG